MPLERVLAQRFEFLGELLADRHREGRSYAHVVQHALIVVQTEKQRPDRIVAALVPAKARHYAVRSARVLHLDQRAFSRLIREPRRLGAAPVEPRPLEAWEPVLRERALAR